MSVVVDSSGWIEYFVDGINARYFAEAIEKPEDLIVPSITIIEVYRWLLIHADESAALSVSALMRQGQVVDLDSQMAVMAADLAHKYKLPLADGVIYTTAQENQVELLTQDADLEGLQGVKYIRHPKRK